MARRGFRGNGRQRFGAGADDDRLDEERDPRPEDSIIVVDAETGNPIDQAREEPPAAEERRETPASGADQAYANLERSLQGLQQQREADARRIEELSTRAEAAERGHVADTARNAIASAEGALSDAKRRYAAAMAGSDYAGAADAQADITMRAAELQQVRGIVRELEQEEQAGRQAPREERREQPRDQPPAQTHDQLVDRYIGSLTPKQQEFARAHRAEIFPEGDQRPLQRVLALSQVAAEDYGIDTPAFFQYLEENMTKRAPGAEPLSATATQQRQPAARRPPSAPVGRGAPTVPRQVALTAEQREMATKLKMSPAKYASYLLQAEEGARDPNYTGPRLSRDDPALSGRR